MKRSYLSSSLIFSLFVFVSALVSGLHPLRAGSRPLPLYGPAAVLESEAVPGVLGRAEAWKEITTHFRVLTGGSLPDGAEAEIGIDVSTGNFIADLFYKIPETPNYKRWSVSLEPHQAKLERYNRISVEVYPEMADRASLWIEAVGAPEWSAGTFPLKARQWNRIWLSLGHLQPAGRTRIKALMFGGTAVGQLPGDPQWQRYYLRDLRFETVPPRAVQGWETSPAYVAVPQVGFAPWQAKTALFSPDLAADTFRLCTAANGKPVYQGELRTLTAPHGRFKVADFSAVAATGRYYVEAAGVRSPVFPITPEPFAEAIDNYLHWLHCMRSGTATPAHPDCFQDDALREDTKEPVDLSGCWFDASDLRIYNSMAMTNIMRPLALSAAWLPPSPLRQRVVTEALWGGDFFRKMWDAETGLPFTMLCVHMPREERYQELRKHYYKNNNYWTDNQPGTADDRIAHTPWRSVYLDGSLDNYLHHLGICAAGAALLNLPDGVRDPVQRRVMLAMTERHFARLRDAARTVENRAVIAGVNPGSTPALALSLEIAVQLGLLTGKDAYWAQAADLAAALLGRQQLGVIEGDGGRLLSGWFDRTPSYLSALSRPVVPITALLFYLEKASAVPAATALRIRAAARIYADLFVRPAYRLTAPYTLPVELAAASRPGALPAGKQWQSGEAVYAMPTFTPTTLGHESVAVTRLAAFLADPDLFALGRELLLPHLGYNPSGWSFVAETGEDYKPDMMSTVLGHMRGMTTIGIQMKEGVPFYPQHYGQNEIYTQVTPFLQGMVEQHASGRFSGQLRRNGAAPGRCRLSFRGAENQEVAMVRTLPQGDFPHVRLQSGQTYGIFADGRQIDEVAVFSGGDRRLELDWGGAVRLTAVATPARVLAGQTFLARVELANYGAEARTLVLRGQGFAAAPQNETLTVQLAPGRQWVEYPFLAGETTSASPYVVMMDVDGQISGRSAAGVVLPLPPAPLPPRKTLDINGAFADPARLGDDLIPAGWRKIMGPAMVEVGQEAESGVVKITAEKTVQLHCRPFAVVPGTRVVLRFAVRAVSQSVVPIAGVHVYGADGRWLSAPASRSFAAETGTWKKYELSAEIPATSKDVPVTTATVCVGINGSGTAEFKMVSVE